MADYSQMSIEELQQAFSQRASQVMGGGQQSQPTANPVRGMEDVPLVTTSLNAGGVTQSRDPIRAKVAEAEAMLPVKQQEQKALSDVERSEKSLSSKQAVIRSAEGVGSAARRLAEQWAKAYEEGGVGNAAKDYISKAAIRLGGPLGDKYRATSALPGRKTEMMIKMMPILTQQGDKEGSVRLVQTIFERLGDTLPKGYSGIGSARDQLATTVENMFGYAKAFYDSGITKKQIDDMSDSELNAFVDILNQSAQRMAFSPEEQQAMNNVMNTALEPIDKIMNKDQVEELPNGLRVGGEFNGEKIKKIKRVG